MQKLYSEEAVQSIAEAIRTKGGSGTYTVGDMAQAVLDLPSGAGDVLASLIARKLTSFDDDSITEVGASAFAGSANLTTLKLYGLMTISGEAAFQDTGCDALVFPKLSELKVAAYALRLGRNTTKLDLTKITALPANSLRNSAKLNTLILRNSQLVTLGSTGAFTSTPFSGGTGGTLYVPQTLISEYQSATNWSVILGYANNQILPIDGSQYEHYYADGTEVAA